MKFSERQDNISGFVLQVKVNNDTELEEALTAVAEVQSMSEIRCPLPTSRTRRSIGDSLAGAYIARGFHVSVSNDGVTFSEEDVLVIYDSTCVHCTVEGSTTTCAVQVCTV